MNIRAERRAAGMTQAELARAANVPQLNLSAYENGRRTPGPEVRTRISTALQQRPSVRVAQHREAILHIVFEHRAGGQPLRPPLRSQATYRLVMEQPRQEDLMEYISSAGNRSSDSADALDWMRIDLTP